MNTYAWIATIICLTGTVVNVKRKNICFTFWAIGEIMWAAFDYKKCSGKAQCFSFVMRATGHGKHSHFGIG